ncbi:hypothetical protein BDR06DRAFT_1005070 [Suillus hirtellus]|nr:hypothetical protein BDR06DRAFT_1005070 [Suillus hirtellus]
MSSTLMGPTFAKASPARPDCQVSSHTLLPNLMDNSQTTLNVDTWRSNVSRSCPRGGAYPPIPHEALPEPQIMEALHLPPYWETRRDSDLTIALISAQCLEHQAECRLIRRRLKCAMIEQELYGQMEQHRSNKLCKADTGVGISQGALRMSGRTPEGMMFDDADSDVSSVVPDSDIDICS